MTRDERAPSTLPCFVQSTSVGVALVCTVLVLAALVFNPYAETSIVRPSQRALARSGAGWLRLPLGAGDASWGRGRTRTRAGLK